MRRLVLASLLLAACKTDDPVPGGKAGGGDDTSPLEPCDVGEVPADAQRRFGWQGDGTFVSPGGTLVVPAGETIVLDGMPIDVSVAPGEAVAYVTIASTDQRSVAVVDLDTLEVLQVLDRGEAFPGLARSSDGAWLLAAGGDDETLQIFAVQPDGTLALDGEVDVGGTTAGVALSPDDATAWVGLWTDGEVVEIDVQARVVTRRVAISTGAWDVVHLPGRDELYVSDLRGAGVSVVDVETGAEVGVVELETGPAGLAVSGDESTVYAAVSNGEVVAAIDTATRSVSATGRVAEADLVDADGTPLPNANVTDVLVDDATGRVYATRGSDNAVSALDATSLEYVGAFPVTRYPAALDRTSDGRLVVVSYKGGGIGPGGGAKSNQDGALVVVDVDDLDLSAGSADVSALMRSPLDRFPFTCDDGFFPVPTNGERSTAIQHVVLIVKENKTLDCLLGDFGDAVPELDVDPEYLRWPPEVSPNLRALVRRFNIADNFYTDALESDSGHLTLTHTHRTHWVEWMWNETARNGGQVTWPTQEAAEPRVGSFFTHLLDHGRTIRVYGEIVGMFGEAADGTQVFDFSDASYPGGAFVNYTVTDEEKARYIAEKVAEEGLADFTYISLPNDHGNGTSPGTPTPNSMTADNDYGMGIIVEAISRSAHWDETAIFILQDDPQGCDDHVDASRSPLLVASPWARSDAYVSHTNLDFLSVFATMERILGVPPMGRPDAAAVPAWDLFTAEPDTRPFTAVPRELPPEVNASNALGADVSARMDFSGPDRNPELSALYEAYYLYNEGRITRAEAERMLDAPRETLGARWAVLEEEAEEEGYAYDVAWRQYEAWAAARGLPRPERPLPVTRVFSGEEEDDDAGGWREDDDE